jgi:hypothetical protein
MTSSGSVSEWIEMLKAGQPEPSQQIWARYVDQLIQLARRKIGHLPQRAFDEEDVVVVMAFEGFLRGVEERRFSRLHDRQDLWQILVMLTERRAVDQIRAERVEKRGGGRVRGESVLEGLVGAARDATAA